MSKKSFVLGLSLAAALTTAALMPSAFAEPPTGVAGENPIAPNQPGEITGGEAPDKPSEAPDSPSEMPSGEAPDKPGGMPSDNSDVSYSGVMTITEDLATDGQTYESANDSENAILMTGGTVTLTNPTINKTGSSNDESADFYGTNAAVFVSGGTMNITGGKITTNGSHANALFAYGEGILNVSNANIKTSANNSGALMVTGGGTLTATYVTATTDGNSSAPIRSDRGGGTMNIENGSYTSNGVGSPVIYSTADISVKDATLESTASEGVVIEGKNSVKLSNVKLTANNTKLNGQSETYKTIFIYQSMSGDAAEGVGNFTAEDSEIITQNGDTFFITNTTAQITLKNNTFINTSGDFLRVQTGKWGESGSNGGQVVLSATEQEIRGNIIVDNLSSLSLSLEKDSFFKGVINGDNTAESVGLSLDADSVVILEGDSYLFNLSNADQDNKNIYGNGHKLFVNGKEVATNSDPAPTTNKKNATAAENANVTTVDDYSTIGFIIAASASFLILLFGGLVIISCTKGSCKKTKKTTQTPTTQKPADQESAIQTQTNQTNGGGQEEDRHAR